MKKSAENSVKVLLRDTILALCRNTLAYRSKVSVEGLIGVTLDDDEIILVSINDMIRGDDGKDRDDSSDSSESESDGGGSSRKKKRRRRKRSGSRDGQDGAPTPKKSDPGIKIKGEDNDDVMVIIKEETPEENPDLEWMKNMDSSFHQQPQDQSGNVYGNFPNLQSSMGAAAYPGPSTMASQQAVTTQGQGPGQPQQQDTAPYLMQGSQKCPYCQKIFINNPSFQNHVKDCSQKKMRTPTMAENNDPEITKQEIVRKEGSVISTVWKYFGFMKTYYKNSPPKIDKKFVFCRVEGCEFRSKYTSQTTNMRFHLERRHADVVKKEKEETETGPIDSYVEKPTLMFSYSSRTQAITEAIAYMIVHNYLPLSFVESQAFVKLMILLEPGYTVPTREMLAMNILPYMYNEAKRIVRSMFSAIDQPAFPGIIHDTWLGLTGESFSTVSKRFIDPRTWEMRSVVLATRKTASDDAMQNLIDVVEECKSEWGLRDPVAVTDNASAEESALNRSQVTHLSCWGNKCKRGVASALKDGAISEVIKKVRYVVSYFTQNALGAAVLQEKYQVLSKPEQRDLTLVIDINSQWNTTLEMLDRYFVFIPAMQVAAADERIERALKAKLLMKAEETIIAKIVAVLKLIKEFLLAISDDNCPTLNVVLPSLKKIEQIFNKSSDEDDPIVKKVKDEIWQCLEHKSEIATQVMQITSFVDPRLKTLSFVSANDREKIHGAVIQEALKLAKTTQAEGSDSPARNERAMTESKSVLDIFVDDFESDTDTLKAAITSEIAKYLAEPKPHPSTNILAWWKEKQDAYPNLSLIARCYLAIPACSTPVESVFCTGDIAATDGRAFIDGDLVDMMVFLNKNDRNIRK